MKLTYEEEKSLYKMTAKARKFTTLKSLRVEKGISQQDLATYLNISLRTYQAYERGEKLPRIDVAIHLARILGKSVEFIWNSYGIYTVWDGIKPCKGSKSRLDDPRTEDLRS